MHMQCLNTSKVILTFRYVCVNLINLSFVISSTLWGSDGQLDDLFKRIPADVRKHTFQRELPSYMWPPWSCRRQSRKIARWNKRFRCRSGESSSYYNSGYKAQAHCEHLDNRIDFSLSQHERLISTDSCEALNSRLRSDLRLRHFVYSLWKKMDLRRNAV